MIVQQEYVILVDEEDKEVGVMEKMDAHRKGMLHRAFSIFIFNDDRELLLQKRAAGKYHSAGMWTNSCCGHPRPGENISDAASRRLHEELNFTADLTSQFSFIYQFAFNKNLSEHEVDHVYFGTYNGPIEPDPIEISAVNWLSIDKIYQLLKSEPQNFTYWFRHILLLPAFAKAFGQNSKLQSTNGGDLRG